MGARLRKIGKRGYYYAVFYDGKRVPKEKSVALGTTLKSAAMRKFARLVEAHDYGRFDPWAPEEEGQQQVTFQQAKSLFLQSRSHLRPHTVRTYDDVLRWLGERLPPNLWLRSVSAEHLKPFIHDASISRASQRKRFTHVRAFLKWCVTTGLLEKNPLRGVDTPKEEKRLPEFLTPDQLERLLRCISADYEMKRGEGRAYGDQILWLKDAIILAVSTGTRQAELLNLRWSGIDFDRGLIWIRNGGTFRTKSGHERAIPMVGMAREVLQRLASQRAEDAPDGYVLTGQGGGRLNGNHVTRRFKHYIRLAKLPENLRWHSLRHTCGSWLAQKGYSLQIIAAILGHSDTRVTQIYSHLAPTTLAEAMTATFGN